MIMNALLSSPTSRTVTSGWAGSMSNMVGPFGLRRAGFRSAGPRTGPRRWRLGATPQGGLGQRVLVAVVPLGGHGGGREHLERVPPVVPAPEDPELQDPVTVFVADGADDTHALLDDQ